MKFSDLPYFLIKGYINSLMSFNGSYSTSLIKNSYLKGQNKTIVTKGGGAIEVYIKDENYGFKPIWVIKPFEKQINENTFTFINRNNINIPSTMSYSISGDSFNFTVYDLSNTVNYDGEELYFRKNSDFYLWLKDHASTYLKTQYNIDFIIDNYINSNKKFLYFGNLYKSNIGENFYNVIHYNIKDFVYKCIPEHQRTSKLISLLDMNFDIVYNEIYGKLKDLYSLRDPYEIQEEYLNYFSSNYNINIDDINIDTTNKREFIKSLPIIIKKKGTYSFLYELWKQITYNNNRFNIYERWHDKNLEGQITEQDYTIYQWLGNYNLENLKKGAGDEWYDRYYPHQYPLSQETEILSTAYTVEFDISTNPLSSNENKILSKEFVNPFIDLLEIGRPINRICDYNILIAPITDLSGKYIPLYNNPNVNLMSRREGYNYTLEGTSISYLNNSSVYEIKHNLDSNYIHAQFFDYDLLKVVPKNIKYINNNKLEVDFGTNVNVYALISKAEKGFINTSTSESWIINHNLSENYIISNFKDLDENEINPGLIRILDEDNLETDVYNATGMVSKNNALYIQTIESTEWTVTHNLGYSGVLLNVYNSDNEMIYPDVVQLIDKNSLSLKFENPVSGYVSILSIGSPTFSEIFKDCIFVISDTNVENYNYSFNPTDVWDTSYYSYIRVDIPKEYEIIIKEMGILDDTNKILFRSKCDYLYKTNEATMSIFYKINKGVL